jgi:hypothetical protein
MFIYFSTRASLSEIVTSIRNFWRRKQRAADIQVWLLRIGDSLRDFKNVSEIFLEVGGLMILCTSFHSVDELIHVMLTVKFGSASSRECSVLKSQIPIQNL